MPNKNLVQDVIPPKKSIRNVKLSERGADLSSGVKKTAPRFPKESAKQEEMVEDFSRPVAIKTEAPIRVDTINNNKPPVVPTNTYKYEFDEPKKSSKKVLYLSVLVLVVLGGFGVSAFFKSAKITITPKNQTVALDDSFSAKKESSTGGLVFQVVTVVKDIEKNVQATGEAKVEKKARGTITIYNAYSTQSQKLVATTRFQTPEGLVYRLINAVTVPGTLVKSGKTVAGSIDAEVEADKVGADYNVGLKDFSVPGLKGDPKYSKIYGRSLTEMTGGFSGIQKIVEPGVLSQATIEMEEALKASLSKDISSQIPADFVIYGTSLTYKFDPVTQANSSTGGALLKKKGTASAIIFDKGLLSRTLVSKLLPSSANDTIKVTNLEDLDFSFATQTPASINTASSIAFSLKGNPQFVWVFDENKIKSQLLGLSKTEAKNVIIKYPTIKEAWIETQPFWNQIIPTDPNKVTLINTLK